jgi:hypothetical protein
MPARRSVLNVGCGVFVIFVQNDPVASSNIIRAYVGDEAPESEFAHQVSFSSTTAKPERSGSGGRNGGKMDRCG